VVSILATPSCARSKRAKESLANVDARVVALSVDDQATTEALITKHGLDFTVGYGADARAIADVSGAFVNDKPAYLQSTGFIIDPDGRVVVSVYSSGAIGRLLPDDVIGMIRYLREHADSVSGVSRWSRDSIRSSA
jgi:peroxiredoxin